MTANEMHSYNQKNGEMIMNPIGIKGTLDSREVAGMVEKDHKNLLADIRTYIKYIKELVEGNELSFQPVDFFIKSVYTDAKGEVRDCYLITKKGCEVVANKLTGAKGIKFTALYVQRFNDMEQGQAVTADALNQLLGNPDFGIRLLTEIKTEREQRRALEATTREQEQLLLEMRPKLSYLDTILQSKRTVPITAIAKDYGMSARAMNSLLHRLGVQYRLGPMWVLYQPYADNGYTQSVTDILRDGKVIMFTCWTQKGRLFLYNLLKNNHGLLPVIEREATLDGTYGA